MSVEKGDTLLLKKQSKDGVWEVVVNGLRTTTVLLIENPSTSFNGEEFRARSTSGTLPLAHSSSVVVKEKSEPSLEPPRGLVRSPFPFLPSPCFSPQPFL